MSLIQVIYQGDLRFVVLATNSRSGWGVELGLITSGPCQWWRGAWRAEALAAIAPIDRFESAICTGELHIGGWTGDDDANLRLDIYPGSPNSASLPLNPYTPEDSARRADKLLFELALQAQVSGSRLLSVSKPAASPAAAQPDLAVIQENARLKRLLETSESKVSKLRETVSTTLNLVSPSNPDPSIATHKLPNLKNRSKGNPTQRKRVVTAMEFESDSDDDPKAGGSSKSKPEAKKVVPVTKKAKVAPPAPKSKKRVVQEMEFESD